MNCVWTILDNGRLYCPVCDPDKQRTQRRDTRRWCGPQPDSPAYEPPPPQPVDAVEWMTNYYVKRKLTSPPLTDILAKLERCRSAGCVGLQDDVCTALGVSTCKQRKAWFSKLSGNSVCPCW